MTNDLPQSGTGPPQPSPGDRQSTMEALNQHLTRFVQEVERHNQVLRRLRERLSYGAPLSADDPFIHDALEATAAVCEATRALGMPQLTEKANVVAQMARADTSPLTKEEMQLLAICSVSQAVNSTLDLDEVLNLVMDTIIRVTGAERGFAMLLDNETGEFVCKAARNMGHETISGPSFEISLSIVNRVAHEGRPIVTTNAQADPRFNMQESVLNYNLRSILCVPLLVKNQVIGVIYADSRIKTGLFSERDLDVLATFANQVATAIDNARLFERITEAKALMDNIFSSIPSGVITIDPQGKITYANRAAANILGISSKHVVGMPYHHALAQILDTPLPRLMEEVRTKEKRFIGYEIEPYLHQRGLVHLSVSLSPLKDANDVYQGIAMVFDDLTETKRLEAVREMFRRYVSPAVVDRLPADPAQLKLGGNRREISILFADIRGFTSLSEELVPEDLFVILNQYLALATQAVLAHEGTLDKFMGDAIMAIFNAPLPQENHALNAVKAAVAIRNAVCQFHKKCEPTVPRLEYGIGLNLGEAIVGNVGTPTQMNYTAIGNAVNLAKRLQEAAEGGQILLSQELYDRVSDAVVVRPVEYKAVKGRKSVEHVYELVQLREDPESPYHTLAKL